MGHKIEMEFLQTLWIHYSALKQQRLLHSLWKITTCIPLGHYFILYYFSIEWNALG